MNKIILIDLPYLIYTSFFRAKKIYNIKNNTKYNKDYLWDKNEEFKILFCNIIYKNFIRIKEKFNITFDNIYLIRDCLRETIWRNNLYSKYKLNRANKKINENKEQINSVIGNLFMFLYNNFFTNLPKDKLKIIKVNEAEADDIIFIFSNLLKKKGYEIIIIGNDTDFYQILDDKICMYDLSLKGKKEINNPKKFLLYKILNGDKTDNINGFKIKKKEYFGDKNYLKNKIDIIYDNIKIYFNNRRIINAKCIPLYMKERIFANLNNLIKIN